LSLTIYDEALRMSNLTNNILDMARLDADRHRSTGNGIHWMK